MLPSLQPAAAAMRGTVLFYQRSGRSGYGFISPEDGSVRVYFGCKAAFGKSLRKGDRVEFEFGKFKPGKGPSAAHLKLIDDDDDRREQHVETIFGETDVEWF